MAAEKRNREGELGKIILNDLHPCIHILIIDFLLQP